jgi:hypothetical protein
LRYESALFGKTFARPGPKSVSPAMNCSGVEVVASWKWIVDIAVGCQVKGTTSELVLP